MYVFLPSMCFVSHWSSHLFGVLSTSGTAQHIPDVTTCVRERRLLTGAVRPSQEMLVASGAFPFDAKSVPPEWQDALMLRFWVGFKKNCKNSADAFAKMLVWRKENKINDIRDKIMGGLTPEKFPR